MGQSRPNEAIELESAFTSTADIPLHRTNRRGGPRTEVNRIDNFNDGGGGF
jgi:hypothetical protein